MHGVSELMILSIRGDKLEKKKSTESDLRGKKIRITIYKFIQEKIWIQAKPKVFS